MARVNVPVTSITPPKAALTTACAGTNNDLVFTAKAGGPDGNNIRVAYIVAGGTVPLTIVVEGKDITVNVATTAGTPTSTSALIKTALEGSVDASALVSVAHAAANDGTGVVAAFAMTALVGGAWQQAATALTNGDATNDHYITGNDGDVVVEVVSSDGSAQNVTIHYSPAAAPGAALAAAVESIPAGATRTLGPFAPRLFNQNQAKDVYFDPAVSNTLDFRAFKITRAT